MSSKPLLSNLGGATAVALPANVYLTNSPQRSTGTKTISRQGQQKPPQLPHQDMFSLQVLWKKVSNTPRGHFYWGQHSIFPSSMSRLQAIQLAVSAAVIQVITLQTRSSSQGEMYVSTSQLHWPLQAAASRCTKKKIQIWMHLYSAELIS